MSKEEIKIKLHSLVKITNNGDSVSTERMFDVEADFIIKLIEIEKRKYVVDELYKLLKLTIPRSIIEGDISSRISELEQEIIKLETELK